MLDTDHLFFSPVALRPDSGPWPPFMGLRNHTRYDSSGRVASPTQRPLPHKTQRSQETDHHATGGNGHLLSQVYLVKAPGVFRDEALLPTSRSSWRSH